MNSFTLCRLASGLLLAALAVSTQAAQVTDTTTPVLGRPAEIVSGQFDIVNMTRPGVRPRVGDLVRIEYVFSDPDGDAESGSSIAWDRDGMFMSNDEAIIIPEEGRYGVLLNLGTDCFVSDPCRGNFYTRTFVVDQ